MKHIVSILLVLVTSSVALIPSVDAGIRIRNGRTSGYSYDSTSANSPYVIPREYYTRTYEVSPSSILPRTYSYSPVYVAGYTYSLYPTSGYYLYNPPYTQYAGTERGQYYYSQFSQAGYTYYGTPVPGYYLYLPRPLSPTENPNNICVVMNGVYQCSPNVSTSPYGGYPGCDRADIIIGGQIWAACNAYDLNQGSSLKSGWFFAGDREATFTSTNGRVATLEWMGGQTRTRSVDVWPCASGYRLPTRGEWETAMRYARANSTSLASLLSLPQNAGYQWSRTTGGDVTLMSRLSVAGAYWTSTYDGDTSIVMHIGSSYAGYNTTGTDYGYANRGYDWNLTDTGFELLRSTTSELANVRCIKS